MSNSVAQFKSMMQVERRVRLVTITITWQEVSSLFVLVPWLSILYISEANSDCTNRAVCLSEQTATDSFKLENSLQFQTEIKDILFMVITKTCRVCLLTPSDDTLNDFVVPEYSENYPKFRKYTPRIKYKKMYPKFYCQPLCRCNSDIWCL